MPGGEVWVHFSPLNTVPALSQRFCRIYFGAGRGGRTPMGRSPADFESAASADSAIPAGDESACAIRETATGSSVVSHSQHPAASHTMRRSLASLRRPFHPTFCLQKTRFLRAPGPSRSALTPLYAIDKVELLPQYRFRPENGLRPRRLEA
jgi:hypothetical protein